MRSFFARFPEFVYDPKNQPELEFLRLCGIRKWSKTSPRYKNVCREFLQALVEDTGDLVHTFFMQYKDFDYGTRASPRAEFERLRVAQRWSKKGRAYKEAKTLFEKVFDREFDSELDYFFKCYTDFNYNPRNEPKAEYNRLRELKWRKAWKSEKERKDAMMKEIEARENFYAAFISVFSDWFGVSRERKNWVFLCNTLGVDPSIPEPIAETAKSRLQGPPHPFEYLHVNIFNLLDHIQERTPIRYFSSAEELGDYSWNNDLRFPLDFAEGTTLKFLLRKIGQFKPEPPKKSKPQPVVTPSGDGTSGDGATSGGNGVGGDIEHDDSGDARQDGGVLI